MPGSLLGNLFGLRQATLHFAQLVCRHKDPKGAAEAGDSHPMHSDDGCKYQEGTGKLRCIFDPFCSPLMNLMITVAVLQEPADDVSESCIASETGDPRTHAAYLYLHGPEGGDFRGGDFFFASQSQERVRLRPATGRMVAIAASSSNLHGVEHLEVHP
ncbi:P4HA1, partial [Symbiodinium necroappetens]